MTTRAVRPIVRRLVLFRDGGLCWLCGLPGATTVDHVIPRKGGGSDALDNLRAAHRDCNGRKGARPVLPPAKIARPS